MDQYTLNWSSKKKKKKKKKPGCWYFSINGHLWKNIFLLIILLFFFCCIFFEKKMLKCDSEVFLSSILLYAIFCVQIQYIANMRGIYILNHVLTNVLVAVTKISKASQTSSRSYLANYDFVFFSHFSKFPIHWMHLLSFVVESLFFM